MLHARGTLHVCLITSLSLATITLAGCNTEDLRTAGEDGGWIEKPPPQTFTASILIDPSSPASNEKNLTAITAWVIPEAAKRPPSTIRFFLLGNDLGSTTLVSQHTSNAPTEASATAAHDEAYKTAVMQGLANCIREAKRTRLRASPLPEAIASIAAYKPNNQHLIIAATDGRTESTLGRWECGPLPAPGSWAATTKPLFTTLRGATTIFTFFRPNEPIPNGRCTPTIERYNAITELWRTSHETVGATFISFADEPNLPPASFLGKKK